MEKKIFSRVELYFELYFGYLSISLVHKTLRAAFFLKRFSVI